MIYLSFTDHEFMELTDDRKRANLTLELKKDVKHTSVNSDSSELFDPAELKSQGHSDPVKVIKFSEGSYEDVRSPKNYLI